MVLPWEGGCMMRNSGDRLRGEFNCCHVPKRVKEFYG